MSVIHHRIRDGQPVYRLWSTIVDAYLTVDLTYEELLVELQTEAVRAALLSLNADLKSRMGRAHASGTSAGYLPSPPDGPTVDLSGPWHPERGESAEEDDDVEEDDES